MKRWTSLCIAAGVIAAGGARAQDPDFNDRVQLLGNSVYNSTDWFPAGTTAANEVSFAEDGLLYELNAGQSSSTREQFKREFEIGEGDGIIWAWYRITIEDVDEIGFYAGLYTRDDDPLGSEPDSAIYFHKPGDSTDPDVAKVSFRTKKDATSIGSDESNLFTATDNIPFDLVIKIDASTATNTVTFWYRESPTSDWVEDSTTSSIPADGTNIHFSIMAFTDNEDGTSQTMTVEVFEFDAPADNDD